MAEDYDAYLAQSGQGAHDALSQLVSTPGWQAMDDSDRVNAAQRIVREARATARANLFAGSPTVADGWADYGPVE